MIKNDHFNIVTNEEKLNQLKMKVLKKNTFLLKILIIIPIQKSY